MIPCKARRLPQSMTDQHRLYAITHSLYSGRARAYLIKQDFVPETRAAAERINAWLEEKKPEAGTPAVGRLSDGPGHTEFSLRGQTISAVAQPYRFYLLQRVQAVYASLDEAGQASVEQMLDACELSEPMTITLDRSIGRAENLEIWT